MNAIAPALPDLGTPAGPGPRDECGFPGETEAEATCREIPVAVVADTCPCGHMNLLRACTGHAREVTGWDGDFIGGADAPGVLTCIQCEEPHPCRLRVTVIWDDMSPAAVIQ